MNFFSLWTVSKLQQQPQNKPQPWTEFPVSDLKSIASSPYTEGTESRELLCVALLTSALRDVCTREGHEIIDCHDYGGMTLTHGRHDGSSGGQGLSLHLQVWANSREEEQMVLFKRTQSSRAFPPLSLPGELSSELFSVRFFEDLMLSRIKYF